MTWLAAEGTPGPSGAVPSPSGPFVPPAAHYHVPKPLPVTGSAAGLDTLISWSLYGALVSCLLGLLGAAGLAAVGGALGRPDLASRGRAGIPLCLAGALVTGLCIPIVNTFYTL